MFDHLLLTAVQSRILLVLFIEGALTTSLLLSRTRISGATWGKERHFLSAFGLIRNHLRRHMTEQGVITMKEVELTDEGANVASKLVEISELMERNRRQVSAPEQIISLPAAR